MCGNRQISGLRNTAAENICEKRRQQFFPFDSTEQDRALDRIERHEQQLKNVTSYIGSCMSARTRAGRSAGEIPPCKHFKPCLVKYHPVVQSGRMGELTTPRVVGSIPTRMKDANSNQDPRMPLAMCRGGFDKRHLVNKRRMQQFCEFRSELCSLAHPFAPELDE